MTNKSQDSVPKTIYEAIEGMTTRLNPDVAGDLDATIQYTLTGEGGGMYHLRIKDGECTAHRGPAISADGQTTLTPNLIINTTPEVWLAISRGEIDGQAAIMQGKYTVDGDFSLLLKLNDMFL